MKFAQGRQRVKSEGHHQHIRYEFIEVSFLFLHFLS